MQHLCLSYRRAERGSVSIIIALAIFVFILGAGVAIDMARAQILQSKIQSALDASGLAAVATLSSKPSAVSEVEWVQQQAQRYFRVNFPTGYLGTEAINITASLDADGNTFSFSGLTPQATTFMQIAGISEVNVGAISKVTRASGGMGLELVLVLDNTGSMNYSLKDGENCGGCSDSKIAALKSSANLLLDILYGTTNDTAPGLFVGVVPFSQAVNIGASRVSWLNDGTNGKDAAAGTGDRGDWGPGGSWAGCVLARNAPYDTNDFNPAATYGGLDVYWYPPAPANAKADADWLRVAFGYYTNLNPRPPASSQYPINGWRTQQSNGSFSYLSNLSTLTAGPNYLCPQPVTAMVTSKTIVKNAIDSMVAKGDTLISEGAVWGWRMLSPNWRGFWGGDMDANALPSDYGTGKSRKVVVLMSDGWNNFLPYNYNAYEWLWYFIYRYTKIDLYMKGIAKDYTFGKEAAEDLFNKKTLEICDSMRASGIEVYTIGFGRTGPKSDSSTVNQDLLRSCAQDNEHYFYAPTNEDLAAAFRQIGNSLVNLRISQ